MFLIMNKFFPFFNLPEKIHWSGFDSDVTVNGIWWRKFDKS